MTVPAEAFDVFSAHAEVVPRVWPWPGLYPGILRTRGGSSIDCFEDSALILYSPHTRR